MLRVKNNAFHLTLRISLHWFILPSFKAFFSTSVRRDGHRSEEGQPAAAVPRDDGETAQDVAQPRRQRRDRPQDGVSPLVHGHAVGEPLGENLPLLQLPTHTHENSTFSLYVTNCRTNTHSGLRITLVFVSQKYERSGHSLVCCTKLVERLKINGMNPVIPGQNH